MAWTLVTAPDERDRCCFVADDVRCDRPPAFRIAGAPPAWDDYTYTCDDHAEMVLSGEPGSVAQPLASQPRIPKGSILGVRLGGEPVDEREHFFRCAACGGWVDKRDLGDVFSHEGPHGRPPQA
jgi:hypothetical protein